MHRNDHILELAAFFNGRYINEFYIFIKIVIVLNIQALAQFHLVILRRNTARVFIGQH